MRVPQTRPGVGQEVLFLVRGCTRVATMIGKTSGVCHYPRREEACMGTCNMPYIMLGAGN